MSFSINTNIGAMKANLYANLNGSAAGSSLQKVATGSSLNNASDLSMANHLSAKVTGLGQAIQNSNESIGMMQIADGAMSGINDNMQRIHTLTLQASNGTLSDKDRAIIQQEIDSLLKSSDDIAKKSSYNGINLLNGSTIVTQRGANSGETQSLAIGDAQVASLVGSIDVLTSAGRESTLDTIDGALNSISDIRSDLGASQNQLMSNIRNISVTQINVASAESNIRDIDFAQESANFSRNSIMSQVGTFAQAQANAVTSNVGRLVG